MHFSHSTFFTGPEYGFWISGEYNTYYAESMYNRKRRYVLDQICQWACKYIGWHMSLRISAPYNRCIPTESRHPLWLLISGQCHVFRPWIKRRGTSHGSTRTRWNFSWCISVIRWRRVPYMRKHCRQASWEWVDALVVSNLVGIRAASNQILRLPSYCSIPFTMFPLSTAHAANNTGHAGHGSLSRFLSCMTSVRFGVTVSAFVRGRCSACIRFNVKQLQHRGCTECCCVAISGRPYFLFASNSSQADICFRVQD